MPLLGEPDFRRYLAARLVSVCGSFVTYVVLPVLVYQVTGSNLWTALVVVAEGVPYVLFGLFAGAVADRIDRRRLMVVTDLVNAAVLASVPAAYALGVLTAGHVLVVAFLTQVLFVFFDAGNWGLLPALVGRDRLAGANSAVHGGTTVLEIVVPSGAGLLLAFVSPAPLILVDALSFLVSALLIRAIAAPLRAATVTAAARLRDDVTEGLRFLVRQPFVRAQTLVSGLQAITGGAFTGQFVPWLDQELGVRPSGDPRLGLMYGVWGVGGVAAAATFTRVVRRLGEPRITLAYVPASALFGIACALAVHWVVAAALLAGWAVSYSTVVLAAITMRQRVTPDHLQSRVNTAGRMLAFGLGWPIGAVAGGVISDATDPRTAIVAMSAPVVVAAVVAWLSPLRTYDRADVHGGR